MPCPSPARHAGPTSLSATSPLLTCHHFQFNMATPEGTTPIPQPPGWPLFGNAFDLDMELPLLSFLNLARQYGEIFRLNFATGSIIYVTNQKLVHEVCDETRFNKVVKGPPLEVRAAVHDGLFTAHHGEPNWGIAHRILMPAFGPMSIQGMYPEMHEIASQLALKWARHGADTPIHVTDDFTRLTLDTLSLCSMDFRFNSYYHDELHPFVGAMGDFLVESGLRSRRPGFMSIFSGKQDRKYLDDIRILRETAEAVLKARKANPASTRKDLLSAMLDGVDPKTGSKLTDASIIDNLITFLIAGHETTSGMLSFAFYHLLKNPETYRKAQKEVDDVLGTGPIKLEHMKQLPYLAAVLRETLRLNPPLPILMVTPKEDEIIGGKYFVPKGQGIAIISAALHTDPAVYGDTVNDFVPERMLDDNFARLNREYPDCWKPFGNGVRGCIGRPFAWQEALLVMAMLLQNFNFYMDDPSYNLKFKQTLTTKPKDFYFRAVLRHNITPTELERRLTGDFSGVGVPTTTGTTGLIPPSIGRDGGPDLKPISIYYGSNTGTCETLAQRLASDATNHGFAATVVDPLDAANQSLPTDRPVVMITATFEGQPPGNAALFCSWMESLKGNELDNVSYAVFGCGHHDWTQTFLRIPKLIDTTVEARGGSRICDMGSTDAAEGAMFSDFESWEDHVFWPAMEAKYGTTEAANGEAPLSSGLTVDFSNPRTSALRQDVKEAVVISAETMTAPGAPPKKHIEIQLPTDETYRSGDYLAVLPINPKETINRVLRRFQLSWDTNVTIAADRRTTLPTDIPVPVNDILGAYVELSQPATKRGIFLLAESAPDETTKNALQSLAGESYTPEISNKRVSILDLLDKFPTANLPFGTFLSLLPPMRVRQYSISSSPLWNQSRITLTYSLLDSPALADPTKKHLGVATSYLSNLAPGDKLNVSVRPSHAAFHLPAEPDKTPLIMVAAGSGIAPFRGFVQERAAQIAAGRELARAVLFFGCRSPKGDDLYSAEFDKWDKMGAVHIRRAYSRELDNAESKGCKYVGDRMYHDKDELFKLWDQGARVYVCGSRDVGENVKQAVVKMGLERKRKRAEEAGEGEVGEESVLEWFEGIRNVRYVTDVFD